MALDYTNLYPDTSNNGAFTKSWNYTALSSKDTMASVSASGYFNKVASRLGIGDNINVAIVDAFDKARTALVEFGVLYVNGNSNGVVTTTGLNITKAAVGLGNVPNVDATNASNITSGWPLVANPTSGTLNQGYIVNQTLPATGSQSTTLDLNEINVTNPGYSVSGGTLDSFGLLASTNGLRVNLTTAAGSIPEAILGAVRHTAPSGNLVGVAGTSYSNISAPSDVLYGLVGYTAVDASGHVFATFGIDCESGGNTGGQIGYRVGCNASSAGLIQGTTLDTAFGVTQSPSGNYPGGVPWVNGLTFNESIGGLPPLTAGGNMIYADGPFTTGSFANVANVAFTNLFNFQNMAMAGDGRAVFGAGLGSIPGAPIRAVFTTTSAGSVQLYAAVNGTSGVDGLQANDSGGANSLATVVWEAGNTTTTFGQTRGNFAGVVAFGANNLGLLLGTTTNEPLIIGTNNTARLSISGTGAITLSTPLTAANGGTGISSLGTGVATALGSNVGSAGAFVTLNGALGTPASGTATNLTGTAPGLTAGNVTTNANLTGDTTSVGNATTTTKINGVDQTVAWSTWTPTVSAGSGTFTTLGTVVARSRTIGKTLFFYISIPITTNGTAALFVQATLPFAAANTAPQSAAGRENGLTGKTLGVRIVNNTSSIQFTFYDGSYPGADGAVIGASGFYEMA